MTILVSLVVLIVVAALCSGWRRRPDRIIERTWRPQELREARLLYAERLFTTWTPFPLAARVDRGYLVGETIVLVELKTRKTPKAHQSDIIELSAQRVAVEASTGRAVSRAGYVVVQHPDTGARTVKEVALLSTAQVISLAQV